MPLKFTKQLIAAESFETAAVFDVNGDGIPDIVSGSFWYQGPEFVVRHFIGPVRRDGEYYDDFSTIAMDINGDGRMDFITGGWFSGSLRWRENPGSTSTQWPEHIIGQCKNVETTRAWDVDGDGQLEIVPNDPSNSLSVYKLILDNGRGTAKFTKHLIYSQPQGHGMGFGDINGDGRGDFVLAKGWLEAPVDPLSEEWKFHPEFDLGSASIPVLVADVNGDGLNDLIVGQAHGYGLDWYEQRLDTTGKRQWIKHPIDPFNSQYHDLLWVDIDGDGKKELITGKRHRAHCDGDPGAHDDVGIYYFKWNGESFSKQVISYGPPGVGAGCGIHFCVADLRGSGRLDIIAPGKDGLYVFFNQGL